MPLLVFCAACRSQKEPVADAEQVVLQALKEDSTICFAHRAAYCLEDPELTASTIEHHLENGFKGEFPRDRGGVRRLISRARGTLAVAQLKSEEHRAQVLSKIAVHYETSVADTSGEKHRAFVDLGIVPTQFVPYRQSFKLNADSPFVDGLQLAPQELARQLLRLQSAHPEAREIALAVEIPGGSSRTYVTYVWYKASHQIGILRISDRAVVGTRVSDDLKELKSGTASLRKGLHGCSFEDSSDDPECPRWWPTRRRVALKTQSTGSRP